MLCVTLVGYDRDCGQVSGGLSDVMIFDPFDLDFTQATPTSAYTAAALRDTATAPALFVVDFQIDNGEWTWKQSVNGCSVKYELEWILQLTENSQLLTNFLQAMDQGGCCCGIGVAFRLNSSRIFIAGERYVNGAAITRFIIKHDGSDGSSGKLLDDYNGANLHLKGSYSRNVYEFTGTWDSLLALSDQAGSGS